MQLTYIFYASQFHTPPRWSVARTARDERDEASKKQPKSLKKTTLFDICFSHCKRHRFTPSNEITSSFRVCAPSGANKVFKRGEGVVETYLAESARKKNLCLREVL